MPKPIKCYQYDLEGNYIAGYGSMNEAAKVNGLGFTGIRECVQGYFTCSQGYIWTDYKVEKLDVTASKRSKSHPVKAMKGKREVEFDTIGECADYIGASHGAVSQAISSQYPMKTLKGWKIRSLLEESL